ncbi:endonuclease/exonuclease/phosphatase (EEP) superfamily protein YafD [Marisediminicola sp. UYEF4]|uniref:endonuclease/exonuclease/phosphatase family protein n=1 Tax=Marisediminicola sp. UYEF4 TaxID=1756384 RepID=UPI003397275D
MIRKIAAAVLTIGLAGILLVAVWPQLLGLELVPVVAHIVSLRAVAAVGALAGIVALLLVALVIPSFRRLGASLSVLLLVFIAATGAVLATRGFGSADAAATADGAGDDLTVLTWNTLGDEPGAAEIARLALETGADIVALPETTRETAVEVAVIMKREGRPMWAHTLALDEISKARSTSLLTSADLGTYSRDTSRGSTSVVPSVIVTPDDGTGPTIVAAHPVAPITGYFDDWREGLEWVKGACTGENIIVAGDFNSTIDHNSRLANDSASTIGDCVDAALTTGAAAVGTWPTDVPPLLGAPIDRVMATDDWTATSVRVVLDRDGLGSDHRPVVATLRPTG